MKKEYSKPKLVILGKSEDIILGYHGVNVEWTSLGSTKPCAGCLS